jgi:hypothetical protein
MTWVDAIPPLLHVSRVVGRVGVGRCFGDRGCGILNTVYVLLILVCFNVIVVVVVVFFVVYLQMLSNVHCDSRLFYFLQVTVYD